MTSSEVSATPRTAPAFHPTVWGDFFINYRPQPSQRSEEWMRKRADELKEEVHELFKSYRNNAVETMNLVDTLQRLAIDYHFEEQIDTALGNLHAAELKSSSLHEVALRFRLLRQHGLWESPDEFSKFKGEDGKFCTNITNDHKGLLSLYNAAQMLTPGEATLEEAIAFARCHLEPIKNSLKSPIAEQVIRAFHIPLPRTLRRIEALHYIQEYIQEKAHSFSILELAKVDFNILQLVHLEELRTLSRWWKDLHEDVGLGYVRDRLVECYFWAHTVYYEEKFTKARTILAKKFALLTVLDDTYDVHATLEESRNITEAMQRWDEGAASLVPEYMKKFYIRLIGNLREFEDEVGPTEKYRVAYNKKALQILSKYYLQESEWFHEGYMPTFNEQVRVSIVTSAIPNLCVGLLIGMDDGVTEEAFQWVMRCTDAVKACCEVTRYMNDFASFKHGRNKRDVASTVECYIHEHKVGSEVAFAKIESLVEEAWQATNQALLLARGGTAPPLAVVQRVVNLSKSMPFMFTDHVDAYTYSKDLRDTIRRLFVDPAPV